MSLGLPTGSHRPTGGPDTLYIHPLVGVLVHADVRQSTKMSVDARTVTSKDATLLNNGFGASWIPDLLGYGLASGVALLADVGVLTGLVKLAHWPYLAAASLAFIAGAAVAYVLSVRFVFKHRQTVRRTVEFSSFVGLGLAGLVVNAAVMFIAVSGAGLALVPAKVLAAGATFTTNFTLRRQMLFAPARKRP